MQKEIEISYIKRILEGETALYSYFLNNYSHSVFTLIVRIVQLREDAEELTQDTFLKAFKKLDSYRGDCSFSTWLYRIAYNTAISSVRKNKIIFPTIEESILTSIPDEDIDSMFTLTENELLLQKMESAIEKLEPDEKALITMFYLQNKTTNELSEILQITSENIRVKMYRIRKKLYVMINSEK